MPAPYRADHLGSFLRPADLLRAKADFHVSQDQITQMENQQIRRVLDKQKDLGFEIFTDGELRRTTFMSDFNDAVDGMDNGQALQRAWQPAEGAEAARPMQVLGVVNGKLSARARLTNHELTFLKQHSPGEIKMTLPSANQFPAIAFKKGITDQFYANYSELLWDVVPIIRSEITALSNEGVRYIQIDAPRYSYFMDPKWRDYLHNEYELDPVAALDEAIKADNACLEGANRDGVILSIHLCRGNNRSQWYAQGAYDEIAEKVFSELNVDRFLLEYDDERSGGFEPLRFVPKGKQVVLGLISTKVPQMESQDDLRRRIDEAAKYMPLDDLALSPQCGFASTAEGNLLTEDEQWAKMRLVVDTAKRVWGTAS